VSFFSQIFGPIDYANMCNQLGVPLEYAQGWSDTANIFGLQNATPQPPPFPRSEDMKDYVMNRRMQRLRNQIELRHKEQLKHFGMFLIGAALIPLVIGLISQAWKLGLEAALS